MCKNTENICPARHLLSKPAGVFSAVKGDVEVSGFPNYMWSHDQEVSLLPCFNPRGPLPHDANIQFHDSSLAPE